MFHMTFPIKWNSQYYWICKRVSKLPRYILWQFKYIRNVLWSSQWNDPSVRVHNNNTPGWWLFLKTWDRIWKLHILFCLSPPYLHTCKANQHMGQLRSPGGIEKLLKLWNNIVIGRNWINFLPFYDDTHLIPLSITSFTRHIQTDHLLWGFAAIVVIWQCAHTYSICERTICHAERR
jgi:hypothetical protein